MTEEPRSLIRDTSQDGDTLVVEVAGDVDLAHSVRFQQEMLDLLSSQPELVIVDLSDVPYMDSSGVASLVKILGRCRRQDMALRLVGLNPRVRGIFEITRLDTVFEMYDTVDEAKQ